MIDLTDHQRTTLAELFGDQANTRKDLIADGGDWDSPDGRVLLAELQAIVVSLEAPGPWRPPIALSEMASHIARARQRRRDYLGSPMLRLEAPSSSKADYIDRFLDEIAVCDAVLSALLSEGLR